MQPSLKSRRALLHWLWEVSDDYQLHPSTFMMAATLYGRFRATGQLTREKLQLTGAACLLLADKFNEWTHMDVGDLSRLSYDAYTTAQLVAMEREVLQALDYNVRADTPMHHAAKPSDSATVRGWCCLYIVGGGNQLAHTAQEMSLMGPMHPAVRMAAGRLQRLGAKSLQTDEESLAALTAAPV